MKQALKTFIINISTCINNDEYMNIIYKGNEFETHLDDTRIIKHTKTEKQLASMILH